MQLAKLNVNVLTAITNSVNLPSNVSTLGKSSELVEWPDRCVLQVMPLTVSIALRHAASSSSSSMRA